jgi:hypothetical protein
MLTCRLYTAAPDQNYKSSEDLSSAGTIKLSSGYFGLQILFDDVMEISDVSPLSRQPTPLSIHG